MADVVYRPDVFEVTDIEAAKRIILTNEGDSTDVRWERETPIMAEELTRELQLDARSVVLDYGTGIGRLAKALIHKHPGLSVIGADISLSMVQLGPGYVRSQRFCPMHPVALDALVGRGLRVDAAFAVWVIQHVTEPQKELKRICDALRPGGRFYILNEQIRCVPTELGWLDDGIDVIALLGQIFTTVTLGTIPKNLLHESHKYAFCATCTL